jgi:hypothetical protein
MRLVFLESGPLGLLTKPQAGSKPDQRKHREQTYN